MNPFQLISKYRSPLMGLAIIWVVLFHATGYFHLSNYQPWWYLCKIGYGGVDIFFFLSGFGLYYASLKKESVSKFYYKRLIRIFPAYIVICLIDNILHTDYSIVSYISKVSTIGFWLNTSYMDWYIPSIVAFYFCFPFYLKIFNKTPYKTTLATVFAGLFLYWLYVFSPNETRLLIRLFLIRIPVFFMGVLAGKLSLDREFRSKYLKPILYTCTVLGFAILFFSINLNILSPYLWDGLYWAPFILIVPGLLIGLSSLFERYRQTASTQRVLTFFGSISLEFYLIHIMLLEQIDKAGKSQGSLLLEVSTMIVIAFISSVLLHKLISRTTSYLPFYKKQVSGALGKEND